MKITQAQIRDFVVNLPRNTNFDSPAWDNISIEWADLTEDLTDWLKSLGIEIDD